MAIQESLDSVLVEATALKTQAEELVVAVRALVDAAKGQAEMKADEVRAGLDELAQTVEDRVTELKEKIYGITD